MNTAALRRAIPAKATTDRRAGRKPPAHITWQDSLRQITITPTDGDSYVTTAEELLHVLKTDRSEKMKVSDATSALRQLLKTLDEWIAKHAAKLDSAFVTTQGGGLLFLAVTKAVEFDPDLQDHIVDLDIALAEDANLKTLRVEVLAVPKCNPENRASFLTPGFTLICAALEK